MVDRIFSFFIALSLVKSSSAATPFDVVQSYLWVATLMLIGGLATGLILGYFLRIWHENNQESVMPIEKCQERGATVEFTSDDNVTQHKTLSTLHTVPEQHSLSDPNLDEEQGGSKQGEHNDAPPPSYVYCDERSTIGQKEYDRIGARSLYEGHYNGGEYEGEMKDGKPDGRGTMRYANGDEYKGQFKKGSKHGKGIFNYNNGDSYTGNWKYDLEHGMGRLKYANRDIYCGQWRGGKRHGSGTMKYAGGGCFKGGWKNNQRHGRGSFKYANGRVFKGVWMNGSECGGYTAVNLQ